MNASFRTAFWALCLGLTVPMILFVGVELASGGRPARKSGVPAADRRRSLRDLWNRPAGKIASRKPASNPQPHEDRLNADRALQKRPSSKPKEPTIVLGPLLEPE